MEANKKSKLLAMIGLAKKAGKVVIGGEQVIKNVRKGIPCIVLLSSEASVNTKKKILNCCDYHNVKATEIDINTAEMAHAIGNENIISAVGIKDISFTEAIKGILKEEK